MVDDLRDKLKDRKDSFNKEKNANKWKKITHITSAVTTIPSLPFIKNKIMEHPKTAALGLTAGALATAYKIHKRNQVKKQEKDSQDQKQLEFVQKEKKYNDTKERIKNQKNEIKK
jgi:hypothetical protein